MTGPNPNTRQPGQPWTFEAMRSILDAKGIDYAESATFELMRGALIPIGRTAHMNLKAGLPERERIQTMANLLGVLAMDMPKLDLRDLLYLTGMGERSARDEVMQRQQAVEAVAGIWAAHLLVDAEVYDGFQEQTSETEQPIIETADQLNVPEEVVRTWLVTRSLRFVHGLHEWVVDPAHWRDTPQTTVQPE